MRHSQSKDWQKDCENVETENVQLWNENGIMLSRIKNQEAKEMVKDGRCFVITSQAIGFYDTVEFACENCGIIDKGIGKYAEMKLCSDCLENTFARMNF
jgi:hypothetical protein